jgi:hypothetical protein
MITIVLLLMHLFAQKPAEPAPSLDFSYFKARVQPLFLERRPGHARCYACHSQGTPFRLQALSPGSSTWNDEESRKNFEAASRVVVAGHPESSPLLRMPLAAEAGGVRFHPGGKHWASKEDPEWKAIAEWIQGSKQP